MTEEIVRKKRKKKVKDLGEGKGGAGSSNLVEGRGFTQGIEGRKDEENTTKRVRSWVPRRRRREERRGNGRDLEGLVDGPVAAVVCD